MRTRGLRKDKSQFGSQVSQQKEDSSQVAWLQCPLFLPIICLSENSFVHICDSHLLSDNHGSALLGQLSRLAVFISFTWEGLSPKSKGICKGLWLFEFCNAGTGLGFCFWSTPHLGGKRSSHFAPMMPLNCPLDLFQSEKKQQRLQFLCCSCSF